MRLIVILGARSHVASFGPLAPELLAAGFDVRTVRLDSPGPFPSESADAFEPALADAVLVMGDADAALAAAIRAAKAGVPVVHLDAGLRCGDLGKPDEVNRVLISRIASMHLTPSEEALETLEDEGVEPERIHFVGSMRAQTALQALQAARGVRAACAQALERGSYALVCMSEPENVNDAACMDAVREGVEQSGMPVVVVDSDAWTGPWPGEPARGSSSVVIAGAIDHGSMVALIRDAGVVVTDAGGVQVEACVIGTPCVTVLPCTEQTSTTAVCANVLVPPDAALIAAALRDATPPVRGWVVPKRWDEAVSERVIRALRRGIIPLS